MDSQGPFRAGDRFLKYEVRSLLGSGGYAFVYHAYDPHLERDVALKIIPGRGSTGRDLVRRAKREAQFQLQLEHENIVRLYDAGATDDLIAYLVMEKLEGRTLREVLNENGTLSPIEAVSVGLQVARALAAAHAERLIHRDVKPENTFITAGNLVKVLDFGIAKVLGAPGQTTDKDRLHGSLLYMSPEQLRGLPVSEKSDLFALGTMLYEALHEHPALSGGPSTFREVGWRQIAVLPRPLHEVASIPLEVSRFVERAILKDPRDRYASMQEFIERAKPLLERLASESPGAPARDLSRGPSGRDVGSQKPPSHVGPGCAVDSGNNRRPNHSVGPSHELGRGREIRLGSLLPPGSGDTTRDAAQAFSDHSDTERKDLGPFGVTRILGSFSDTLGAMPAVGGVVSGAGQNTRIFGSESRQELRDTRTQAPGGPAPPPLEAYRGLDAAPTLPLTVATRTLAPGSEGYGARLKKRAPVRVALSLALIGAFAVGAYRAFAGRSVEPSQSTVADLPVPIVHGARAALGLERALTPEPSSATLPGNDSGQSAEPGAESRLAEGAPSPPATKGTEERASQPVGLERKNLRDGSERSRAVGEAAPADPESKAETARKRSGGSRVVSAPSRGRQRSEAVLAKAPSAARSGTGASAGSSEHSAPSSDPAPASTGKPKPVWWGPLEAPSSRNLPSSGLGDP